MDQNGNLDYSSGCHTTVCNGKCCVDWPSFPRSTFESWLYHIFGVGQHFTAGSKQKCKRLASRNRWFRSYGLVMSEDMPHDLREMYLQVGYRPIPSSYWYCVKSIFYPTNETMNFWTHFIALLILIHRLYSITGKLQGPLSDPLYYPLWVYAFGACIMLLGSCVAHMFCSHSRNIRDSCWFCDYASITLSSLGSSIIYHNYICPYECVGFPINNYIQLLGIGGVIGHAACCYSRRVTSSIRYALRSSVFVFLYIGSSLPCGYMYILRAMPYLHHHHDDNSTVFEDVRCNLGTTSFVPTFTLVTVFCSLTVFFNVSKIPEKWYPGSFDIIGHSHQLLHICIALAFYTQTYLIEGPLLQAESMISEGSLSLEDLNITWWNTIGAMLTVGLCCLGTSFLMSGKSEDTLAKTK